MPGKHQESWVARLSRNRYPLVIAVVLLCIGVAGVFAAIANRRSPSRPLMYLPASSPSASLVPSPAPSSSPSPSLSPSPSPSVSVSVSPSPSRTRSPSPSRTPSRSPSAAPSFTARYVVVDGRRSTFQVGVVITNTGRAARSWRLVVTHDPDAGVRVEGAFGAELSTSGDTITLRGEALQPGRRVTVGFRATSDRSRDEVRPTSCTIEGTACDITSGRYRNETAARTR